MCARGKMLFSLLFNASHYQPGRSFIASSMLQIGSLPAITFMGRGRRDSFNRLGGFVGWVQSGVSCRSGGRGFIDFCVQIETELDFGTESLSLITSSYVLHLYSTKSPMQSKSTY